MSITNPTDASISRAIRISSLKVRHEARSPPGQWRVLLAALATWGLAAWAVTAPGTGAMLAVGSGALAASSFVCWSLARSARSRHVSRTIVSLLLLPCAMMLLVGVQIDSAETARQDHEFVHAAASAAPVEVVAVLSSFPEFATTPFGENGWFRAAARTSSGNVPIIVWVDDRSNVLPHWAPGTVLKLNTRLEALPPGDSAAYAASPISVREAAEQPIAARLGATAAFLRMLLIDASAQVAGAELVPGFAVGDTSLVDDVLEQAMLASSLTHLTAVSGSNTGLVIAVVIWCVSRLGLGRKARIISAASGLCAFVTIVGPDASVQRASAMAAVLLIGDFGGRRSSALASLGIAVVVLLALDPWQSLQPGFALSVAATAGILLFAPPISKWLSRRVRLPRWLALPFAIAVAAQLSCGPLLLLLEPGVPIVGVLANLLAAPAAPLGTGLGLLSTVLGPISSPLAHLAVVLASFAARWVAATAEVCSSIPGGRLSWPAGWAGAAWLAACELALLLSLAIRRGSIGLPRFGRRLGRQPWQREPHPARALQLSSSLLTTAALATAFGFTVVTPTASRLAVPTNWTVVACDVGQGDALLLRDPDSPQQVMLVDTGDDRELLAHCLDRFGVSKISILVLSHDDRDHVGALDEVLQRTDRALIAPSTAATRTEDREVVHKLLAADVPFEIGGTGLSMQSRSGGLSWWVLAPRSRTAPSSSNAASLVMMVEAGTTRVLLLGDTGEAEQTELLNARVDLRADILKVAHHGSADQASTLPDAVEAHWAVVSVGQDNGYGHPAHSTLNDIERVGTRVLRTDRSGSLALRVESGELVPWLERGGAGQR